MRSLVVVLSASLALLAPVSSAHGQEATEADWLRVPNAYDLMAVFPQEAMRRGKSGEALIRCKVSRQGALYECAVVKETPEGMGFGAAAVALTPQFQMKPAMADGRAVVDIVNIPIRFQAPEPSIGSRIPGGGTDIPKTQRFLASPVWADAPSYADVVAAYPSRATEEAAGGSATVSCDITTVLGLNRCDVIAEEPRGKGFGRAATQLSDHFRLAAPGDASVDLNGVTTQYRVTFAPEMLSEGAPLIGKPQWTGLPSAKAIAGAYPAAAKTASFEVARVQMRCSVSGNGAVETCEIVSETPEGLGFGQTALSLAPYFRLSVWTDEGLPTIGGRVIIPLRFEPPKPPAAAN